MAVTKIKAKDFHIKRMINYATDEAKAKDGDVVYESVLNCSSVENAYAEMTETKRRWKKEDGVKCYHLMQSFKPGETTPEVAHQIGVELAQRCFPNYEVVVGTHLNKAHIHNHVVWNSVSFVDGSKYRNNFKDYFGDIRTTSDELCRKYGLSVIEKPQGRGKHYAEWKAEQEGRPTIRSQIRADIDEVIPKAINFDMFVGLLRARGFKVKIDPNHKYITLLAPYAKKPIRISEKLGRGYTIDEIKKRIATSLEQPYQFIEPPKPRRYYCAKKLYPVRRYTGNQALFWRYVYMIRRIKGQETRQYTSPKMKALLRTEVIKLRSYVKQHNFLDSHNLTDINDVKAYRERLIKWIETYTAERHDLNRQKRGGADVSEQIAEINKELQECRADIKTCDSILENHEKIKETIAQLQAQQEQKETAERQESEVSKDE